MAQRLKTGAFGRLSDGPMDRMKASEEHNLGALAGLLEGAHGRRSPPVERWQPPYCGDIGLQIRADGTWLYRNSPIRRDSLVRLFASVLRKDEDGRTYLVTPAEKVDVAVEDAPFLAVEMHVRGHGTGQELILRTNVEDVVCCGRHHPLRFARQMPGGGLKPYVLVRGRLEALFARALVYDLAALAVEETREWRKVPGVWSGTVFFAMGPA
jgi:uncharacterized protein